MKHPPVPIRRHKVFSIYLYKPFVTQHNVVMWLHKYHWSMLQLISSASVISDKGSQQTCICSKMSAWRDSVKNIHNIFTCEDLLARKSAVVCEILIKAAINISLLKYISIWSDFRKKYRVMTLTSSHTCTHTHTHTCFCYWRDVVVPEVIRLKLLLAVLQQLKYLDWLCYTCLEGKTACTWVCVRFLPM